MADQNRSMNFLLVILLILCVLNFGLCIWLVKENYHRPPEFSAAPPPPPPPQQQGSSSIIPLQPPPNQTPRQQEHQRRGMRGMRGMHGRFQPMMQQELDSPEMQAVFRLLGEYYPEWKEMFEKAKDRQGRRQLRRKLWRYWPKITKLAETYRNDPKLAEKLIEDSYMRNQADKLAKEYHRTKDPDKRAQIKKELTELLSRQFEVRQWIRERRLSNLEKQIKKLRTELRQRLEKRDELIRHQLKLRLEQDAQDHRW